MAKRDKENLEEKINLELSNKNSIEIGKYLIEAPINVSKYIWLNYLPKQSKDFQKEIAESVTNYIIKKDNLF